MRFALRESTRQISLKCPAGITGLGCGAIPIWLSTSSAAPVADMSRTRQSIAPRRMHRGALQDALAAAGPLFVDGGFGPADLSIGVVARRGAGFCRNGDWFAQPQQWCG
jgi:hypothetical protein